MSNETVLTAPFVTTTGELTTPATLLSELLGEANGNPASSLFVCKPYLNGKRVSYVNIGLERPFYVPNVMIGGGSSTFKYLHTVLLHALELQVEPSLPLNYTITGKGIHNFPKTEEPTEVVEVTLSKEDVAELKKVLDVPTKAANPENIGNLNLSRTTNKGKKYNIGFMTMAKEPRALTVLEKLLKNTDLTWHLEFTNNGKEWFAAVK